MGPSNDGYLIFTEMKLKRKSSQNWHTWKNIALKKISLIFHLLDQLKAREYRTGVKTENQAKYESMILKKIKAVYM